MRHTPAPAPCHRVWQRERALDAPEVFANLVRQGVALELREARRPSQRSRPPRVSLMEESTGTVVSMFST